MPKMKFAVVVFPGSNCDHDCVWALEKNLGAQVKTVWHKESSVGDVDAIVLPGGFSYGDYLRTGAVARFSPVMKAVAREAQKGTPVIGICNGFQILLEAGLLSGAMLRNKSLKFVCQYVNLRVENAGTIFTSECKRGDVLRIPIAHGEGNYYADDETLKNLVANKQIVFRYCDENGKVTAQSNPNGSRENIAGIVNEAGNVLGMMPHPERSCDPLLGSADGRKIFESLLSMGVSSVLKG